MASAKEAIYKLSLFPKDEEHYPTGDELDGFTKSERMEKGRLPKWFYEKLLKKHDRSGLVYSVKKVDGNYKMEKVSCLEPSDKQVNITRETKSGKVTYKCNTCEHRKSTRAAIVGHFEKVHNKRNPTKCTNCTFSTYNMDSLQQHRVICGDDKEIFSCDKCPYKTKRRSIFKRHNGIHTTSCKNK